MNDKKKKEKNRRFIECGGHSKPDMVIENSRGTLNLNEVFFKKPNHIYIQYIRYKCSKSRKLQSFFSISSSK